MNSCLPLWPGELFSGYWTECSSASHPSRKTACVFKNPENAGMVRKMSFQAKSYLFTLNEMFKHLGSGVSLPSRDTALCHWFLVAEKSATCTKLPFFITYKGSLLLSELGTLAKFSLIRKYHVRKLFLVTLGSFFLCCCLHLC
jgi:hypothetical protein